MASLSSSYCYSDTIYGATGNAATANVWSMAGVLPDGTPAHISVKVNGLVYRYTAVKDPDADMVVYVRNEDPINGGYIFEEVDDWSGLEGGNIQKYFRFEQSDWTNWGDGSITIEGDGSVINPEVVYTYRMDIGDEINCPTPLADPRCDGYAEALAAYISAIEEPTADDPFYSEWVQASLDQEAEQEDEDDNENVTEEEQEKDDFEARFRRSNINSKLVDSSLQNQVLMQLSNTAALNVYYVQTITGGVYEEAITLSDTTLPDNGRAMKSLASDANHRTMVRSQYE